MFRLFAVSGRVGRIIPHSPSLGVWLSLSALCGSQVSTYSGVPLECWVWCSSDFAGVTSTYLPLGFEIFSSLLLRFHSNRSGSFWDVTILSPSKSCKLWCPLSVVVVIGRMSVISGSLGGCIFLSGLDPTCMLAPACILAPQVYVGNTLFYLVPGDMFVCWGKHSGVTHWVSDSMWVVHCGQAGNFEGNIDFACMDLRGEPQ